MIYFLRVEDDGPIKIGQTLNMTNRLAMYWRQYGPSVALLGVMPGGRNAEKELLQRFSHLRVSDAGANEWRHPAPELLEYIKGHTSAWNGEDDQPASRMETIFHYKANERAATANRDWLLELSNHAGVQVPVVFDQALMLYAKSVGFSKRKPTRRVERRRAK